MSSSGAIKQQDFVFNYSFVKASDPTAFFTGTFASGEVLIHKRTGGTTTAGVNITNLPSQVGSSSVYQITLEGSTGTNETNCDEVIIEFAPATSDFVAENISISFETTASDVLKVQTSTVSGIADFKADVSSLATSAEITALNDFDPAADTVANVTTVGSVTAAVTTDSASRTASQADVSALATSAEIAALNDIAATDIVSGGAITTSGGAVSNVTLVATTTTNTDMRGTDNAASQTSVNTVDTEVGQIKAKTDQLTFTVANQVDANALTGASDATAANQTTIINHLTDVKGTGWVAADNLAEIAEDVTGLNGDAMRGTDSAYTGTPPTTADIADAVWDEQLTGATHNIPTSSGRRLREVAEVGLYEGASVWIDTVNGTAGTGDYENGTVNNPSDNIADATTIANSVGLSRFRVAPASSFTLATGYTGFAFSSEGMWTLALGGQSLTNTTIVHAEVSGTCTSADEPMFDCCDIGTVTLPACFVRNSRLQSDITLTSAGTYYFEGCMSAVAGTASPSIDFGATVGSTNVNFRHYSGGIEVRNMGQLGTDNMSLEGDGALTINANCTGGTIAVRGNFKVTDNSGGAVTVVRDDDTSNIESILADTGTDGVALSTATLQSIADEILKRDVDNVEATANEHTLATIILCILESSRSSTTWTIKRSDGTTTHATKTLTLDSSAQPVTGVD